MRKGRWIWRIALACCIMAFTLFVIKSEKTVEAATTISAEGNIIVLLDASGSMAADSEEAIRWVYSIASLCKETDITLTVVTFRSSCNGEPYKELLKNELITDENLNALGKCLEKVSFDGLYTDQREAIRLAEGYLETYGYEDSYVVLVSDGQLDYAGRTSTNASSYTDDEKAAIEEFKDICEDIAQKGSWVYLVEFKRDVDLFDWDGREIPERIVLIPKEETAGEVFGDIFANLGIEVETEDGTVSEPETGFSFQLDEDCERAVICIVSEEEISADQSFAVYYGTDEDQSEQVIPDDILMLTQSAYLYLEYPVCGTYQVVAEGLSNLYYRVMKVSRTEKLDCEFTWYDGDGNELEKNGDSETYLTETSSLRIHIEINESGFDADDISEIIFGIDGEIVDFSECEYSMEGENLTADILVEGILNGTHKYLVKVETEGQTGGANDSKKIKYNPPLPDPIPLSPLKVNEQLNLGDMLKEAMSTYSVEDLSFYMDEILIKPKNKEEGDEYELTSSLYLTFFQEGSHTLEVSDGVTTVIFNITVEEKGKWWEQFLNKLREWCPWLFPSSAS